MKKLLFLISAIISTNFVFGQHEGIERHFDSYKLNFIAEDDFTFYDDTCTDNFHNYLPQQKQSLNPLGFLNPGNPFTPALFSQREYHDFWFFNNYKPYLQNHDDIIYFDAKKPFTIFKFAGGGRGQEIVNFMHTQNINPGFNFAFNYDIINSDGHYQNNQSKVNALSLATAYTKRKYQNYFNFIFNKINHNNNGGLRDPSSLENNYGLESYVRDINLYQSTTALGQLGLQFNHEYQFGTYVIDTIITDKDTSINKTVTSNFSFIHDVKADKYYRTYSDVISPYYANIYRDSSATFDSLTYRTIDNNLLLKFKLEGKGKIEEFSVIAGISNYLYNYGFDSTSQTYISNYVLGKLSFNTERIAFSSDLKYCFAGADIFDTELDVSLNFVLTEETNFESYFGLYLYNPDIFSFYYQSNHFEWDNDFDKVNTIAAGASLNLEKYNLALGTHLNLLNNYIIYNYNALPQQINSANIVAEIFLNKQFDFGNFHWFNQFSWQYISNRNTLPLPEYVAYTSFYFKKYVFNNALLLQLGFDVKYHSGSYAYAYMPATGSFYMQNNKEIGNYPNAGLYGVVKVKRLRGFAKISNFNSAFLPAPYYLLYRIPDNPLSFNFGVSWEFYD